MEVRTAYTIGFTQHSAAEFFGSIKGAGIKRLLDVRLRPASQLAGFAKQRDLEYFLSALCGTEYAHEPLLTPTEEMLDDYRKKKITWSEYEKSFLDLLSVRRIELKLSPALFDVPTVLLCSEHSAQRCHRRLVLDYLEQCWGSLRIVHLQGSGGNVGD